MHLIHPNLLPNLPSFEESLSSLGAVGGSSGANGDQTEKNKKVNEQNVAVPKNVQRNIISRERDGRKVKREKQPRNMMNQQDHEQDQLEHHPGAALTLTFRNNESESEMIEADQQDNQSFMDLQPLEVEQYVFDPNWVPKVPQPGSVLNSPGLVLAAQATIETSTASKDLKKGF